jgi:hypothetical protein
MAQLNKVVKDFLKLMEDASEAVESAVDFAAAKTRIASLKSLTETLITLAPKVVLEEERKLPENVEFSKIDRSLPNKSGDDSLNLTS